MNLEDYQDKMSNRNINAQLRANMFEQFELFISLAHIKELSFYKYNYEYNDFLFEFTMDKNGDKSDQEMVTDTSYSILIKYKEIIFGKVIVPSRIKGSPTLIKLFKKIKKNFLKQYELDKELSGAQSSFNIYIIHDDTLSDFAKSLSSGLKGLFNVDVHIDKNIRKRLNELKSKEMKHILIYLVNDEQLIEADKEIIEKYNELIIVIGPNDHKLSIYSGQLGVENYIPINEFKPEEIKSIILDTRNKLINKNRLHNKIIAFTGIAGGTGTTTIAMNTANELASALPLKNVLYIDLASTKAVSNLFLERNPLPDKSILDLINSAEFNISNNLENGLVKITENFYTITGIQRHIDKELLEQNVFIERLLDYIVQANDYFNFIIIDVGSADASNLKTTIYDLVNEVWLITQMNLPHISKMKTFYNLMKRAGLREKISFIFNRYDSENSLTISDVTSVLNMNKDEKVYFDYRIPNDYKTLGKAWNYCELVTTTNKDSIFVKSLQEILANKGFYSLQKEAPKKDLSSLFSIFKGKNS